MSVSVYTEGGYAFFYNGPFSNWFPAEFTIDGIKYNCGEQYMMHVKALFFKDKETAKKIMQESRPAKQKELGRSVKNYNDNTWSKVRYELVKNGLKEKFNQNKNLKKFLLSYRQFIIVEASPFDRIWGIGYDDRCAINNVGNWGENLLGKILTELANENGKNRI
jgi:ribA/ribD-fused uncharacterized protein